MSEFKLTFRMPELQDFFKDSEMTIPTSIVYPTLDREKRKSMLIDFFKKENDISEMSLQNEFSDSVFKDLNEIGLETILNEVQN